MLLFEASRGNIIHILISRQSSQIRRPTKKAAIGLNGGLRVVLAPHDNHCTIRDEIRFVYHSIIKEGAKQDRADKTKGTCLKRQVP